MPIRHVYERITGKIKHAPLRYEFTLEGGTKLNLPGSGYREFERIEEGDRMLIDLEWESCPEAAWVNVFRDLRHFITGFGVNVDYIVLPDSEDPFGERETLIDRLLDYHAPFPTDGAPEDRDATALDRQSLLDSSGWATMPIEQLRELPGCKNP